MREPFIIAAVIAAAVPSILSPGGKFNVWPINDLRDGPTNTGKPKFTI